MPDRPAYRGRFAPSPTGPLHLGSLIAALASYLDAKSRRGSWLVRMEDLDPPREEPGAAEKILHSLQAHGLHWDEKVLWQSQRHRAYAEALAQLQAGGHLFACRCTRAAMGPGGHCGGQCRVQPPAEGVSTATRIDVPTGTVIRFGDPIQGEQEEALGRDLPDFVLCRKDGLFAYQLAVVVDDAFQGITEVLRGSDLLDSTARQLFLQGALGFPHPQYTHIPVITHADGSKLSKQNLAPALDDGQAPDNLRQALDFLGQPCPAPSLTSPGEILAAAVQAWQVERIPRAMALYRPESVQ